MSRLPLLFSWGQTAKVYNLLQETRSSFQLKVGIPCFACYEFSKNISFTFKHPRLLGFASPSFFSYSVDPVGPKPFWAPRFLCFSCSRNGQEVAGKAMNVALSERRRRGTPPRPEKPPDVKRVWTKSHNLIACVFWTCFFRGSFMQSFVETLAGFVG